MWCDGVVRAIGVMTRRFRTLHILALALLGLTACSFFDGSTTIRQAGQVELFEIDPESMRLRRAMDPESDLPDERMRVDLTQNWGDNIRYMSDVITIQVHSLYLEDLPFTLTGSRDVAVFAEIWENAASAYGSAPLTSIAYLGKNQLVPGRMNFSGAIVYGPAAYKGTPLKIRFTVIVLQRDRGAQQAEFADVINKYVALVPSYGVIASEIIGVIRDMLRAQPDVIAFDYDAVLLSKNPSRVMGTQQIAASSSYPAAEDEEFKYWDRWDKRFGWLRYSMYALVETEPRTSEWEATSSRNKLYSDNIHCRLNGGWLENHGSAVNSYNGRINNNYLIFSVTPRQIEMSDEFLRAASDSNAELLSSLRQTDSNVNATLQTVKSQAERLEQKIIRARLESEGNKLATERGQTVDNFHTRFNAQATDIRSKLPGSWSDSENDAAYEAIVAQVRERYADDLASLKAPVDFGSDVGKAQLYAERAASELSLFEQILEPWSEALSDPSLTCALRFEQILATLDVQKNELDLQSAAVARAAERWRADPDAPGRSESLRDSIKILEETSAQARTALEKEADCLGAAETVQQWSVSTQMSESRARARSTLENATVSVENARTSADMARKQADEGISRISSQTALNEKDRVIDLVAQANEIYVLGESLAARLESAKADVQKLSSWSSGPEQAARVIENENSLRMQIEDATQQIETLRTELEEAQE